MESVTVVAIFLHGVGQIGKTGKFDHAAVY
jgi:hypothetical protein